MNALRIPQQSIDFASLSQVAEGVERTIHISANYPDVVFKLQKPLAVRQKSHVGLKAFLLNHWAGFEGYSIAVENKTYLRLCLMHPECLENLPMARIYGFISSDAGVLQMCEKVTLDCETLGPSLRKISQQGGFSPDDIAALNDFVATLLASRMATHDVTVNNIVKGIGANGQPRFVLVDGIGDVNLIPVRKYSARVQRDHLLRSFARFNRVDLAFDPVSFTFRTIADT